MDTYNKQLTIDGEICTINVLDGPDCHEEYDIDLIRQVLEQTLDSNAVEGTGIGIVLLYSITSKSSYAYVDEILRLLQQVLPQSSGPSSARERLQLGDNDHGRNRLFLSLVGNKADFSKSERKISQRQVTPEEGRVLAQKIGNELGTSNGCSFTETSAKYGGNEVDDVFTNIVREMRRQRVQIDEQERSCCLFL